MITRLNKSGCRIYLIVMREMSKQRSAKNEKTRKGATADVSDCFSIKLTDSLLAGYTITYCENNMTFSIRHFNISGTLQYQYKSD